MNMNGSVNPTRENRNAAMAVLMIGASAMDALAYAANATGGVTIDIIPK